MMNRHYPTENTCSGFRLLSFVTNPYNKSADCWLNGLNGLRGAGRRSLTLLEVPRHLAFTLERTYVTGDKQRRPWILPRRVYLEFPMNPLHIAVLAGSTELIVTALSRGAIDIDERDPNGSTGLVIAATIGHARVARTLLNRRADVTIANDRGATALHASAQDGHLAVTKLLITAGADLEAAMPPSGSTPLRLAAEFGHVETVTVLIEAGANPNIRMLDGITPLYCAAHNGHVGAVKVLLRANANPLLPYSSLLGDVRVPLDTVAQQGHLEVARELIQEHGIEGCGGASCGVSALQLAAQYQQLEMMGVLTSAGVVDTGLALIAAASFGGESSVKHLLQQQEGETSGQGSRYPDTINRYGATPLLCTIKACLPCSPRITRLLMDAGADTTKAVRLTLGRFLVFDGTPVAFVDSLLSCSMIQGQQATQEQLYSLEGTRRLLMRAEAVHAVSWLWQHDPPSADRAAAVEGAAGETEATSPPLASMMPILRRRAQSPRVLWAALFRATNKP